MTTDDRNRDRNRSADRPRDETKRAQPAAPRSPPAKSPTPSRSRDEATPTERSGSIAPQLIDAGDGSIGVAWRPIQLGPANSYGCAVTCAADHALAVTIEQGAYQKTSSGVGSVDIAAIPVAAAGTAGQLTVVDRTSGANVQYRWEWRADGSASGAPAKLFRRQASAQPPDLVRRAARPDARARGTPPNRTATRSAERTAARSDERTGVLDDDASTVFFGQPARGTRFAFVLDVSGSMQGARWEACRRECEGALIALVGAGDYCIVLFASDVTLQPNRDGWTHADAGTVEETLAWLAGVAPSGGTFPKRAFEYVYALAQRPDVVYFLTDGQLAGFTPDDCARLRRAPSDVGVFQRLRGAFGRTAQKDGDSIVNTITLDDRSSEAALQAIAAESGGGYVAAKSAGVG